MSQQKKLSHYNVLEIIENLKKAEYTSVLKEAADRGAKMAIEAINNSQTIDVNFENIYITGLIESRNI